MVGRCSLLVPTKGASVQTNCDGTSCPNSRRSAFCCPGALLGHSSNLRRITTAIRWRAITSANPVSSHNPPVGSGRAPAAMMI